MSKLHAIYQKLRTIRDESVGLALSAALPTADPEAAQLIGLSLLERRDTDGMLSLVKHFHHLPYDVQEIVVRHNSELHHALRVASEDKDGPGPENVVHIINRSKSLRLAYLLIDLLRYGSISVRTLAAGCLLELAHSVAHAHEEPSTTPVDVAGELALANTIEEAITLYRHHAQTDVLLAIATLAPRPMPGVLRIFQDRTNPAAQPMRVLIEAGRQVEIRRSLFTWLRVAPLVDVTIARLQATNTSGLADVLHNAHLLLMGSVVRALKRLPAPENLCPLTEQLDLLPAEARRSLPRWIAVLPLEPPIQAEMLGRLTRDTDRATRLAALSRLMALAGGPNGECADGVISTFCSDADRVIARIALRHLVRRRWPGLARLLVTLVHSPHEEIRTLAGANLAPLGFAKFWDAWPKLGYAQQLAGGNALIKLDPNFHRLLGERLARPDRNSRLRAMAIIYGLNQATFFEAPLLALAREPDEVIASAAVRSLGSASSPTVIEALELALRHADSRVRANSVESLQQIRSTRHVNRLMEMARNDDSRPRANAIHALLEMKTSDALASLTNMLADNRPPQRISALWLVDHLGLVDVARHVAELAITDPDQKVKARAGVVIQHLIGSIHPPQTEPRESIESSQSPTPAAAPPVIPSTGTTKQ